MTTSSLLTTALSLLALSTLGCAATVPASPEVPGALLAAVPTVGAGDAPEGLDQETAERVFLSMAERCQRNPEDRSESTRMHCIAATNLATNVLRDARRAENLLRLRCARFGASDTGNPLCSPAQGGLQGIIARANGTER